MDVLDCLANLSNDEVFTSPAVVNRMLDTLPEALWSDPNAKFLDPFTKSGVFLREIAKRLMKGLATVIPDPQERLDHILGQQLYGIAITQLTALMARRTLYCSKDTTELAHCLTDIFAQQGNPDGNIYFAPCQHTFVRGKCSYCGATEREFGAEQRTALEQHAYLFIHNKNPYKEMQFDVIIGNPPYQLGFGIEGANSSNARAIYHLFIDQAIKLNPKFICMIVPSRWMTRSTQGVPDEWIDRMLSSNKFRVMHDFQNSNDVFQGVDIKGGVNYFLWDKDYDGICDYYLYADITKKPIHRNEYLDANDTGIIVRDIQAATILDKISDVEGNYIKENNFSNLVSPKHFFDNSVLLTSNWNEFSTEKTEEYNIKYYPNKKVAEVAWIRENQIPKNKRTKDLHKVFIPAAGGTGTDSRILGMPFYGEPNSVCSQTYLVIGYNPNEHHFTQQECENIISYIKTRFFRYLVSIKKKTQNGPRGVYQFVPLQDFTEEWTDEKLYKKYGLTAEEIAYIEEKIDVME